LSIQYLSIRQRQPNTPKAGELRENAILGLLQMMSFEDKKPVGSLKIRVP
jgi:hypothetical protein